MSLPPFFTCLPALHCAVCAPRQVENMLKRRFEEAHAGEVSTLVLKTP